MAFAVVPFYAVAQTNLSAKEIVTAACQKAATEKKNVIIIFHASWRVWCLKMDSSMNDVTTSKFFSDNYVTILTCCKLLKIKTWKHPEAKRLLNITV